jgi:hypothetical protein
LDKEEKIVTITVISLSVLLISCMLIFNPQIVDCTIYVGHVLKECISGNVRINTLLTALGLAIILVGLTIYDRVISPRLSRGIKNK